MNGLTLVDSTGDPAFAVDLQGRIRAWNRAAERVLGFPASSAVGRLCRELLVGRDVFDNDYCTESCPLLLMAQGHQAVHRCELLFRHLSGGYLRTEVSCLTVSGDEPAEQLVVHLLRPLGDGESAERLAPSHAPSAGPVERLTPRETEVLKLLGDGTGTEAIADDLGVTVSTVRSHIEHILGKLHVHSRTEAVALAWRSGMLS